MGGCVPAPWEAWGRSRGNRGTERIVALKLPYRAGHRALGTQTAKDQITALNGSLLLGPTSRNHHYRGCGLLLHGQDITDTSLGDTVPSVIPPSLALLNLEDGRHMEGLACGQHGSLEVRLPQGHSPEPAAWPPPVPLLTPGR